MKRSSKCLLAGAALLTVAACADSNRTASGYLCDNGRPEVAITGGVGWGASYSCDPRLQNAVDDFVRGGREYRVLSMGEAYAAANGETPGIRNTPTSSPIGMSGVRAQ